MVKRKPLDYLIITLILGTLISGCTTYTWPDGSRETVVGVPADDENERYEETQNNAVRYRIPGETPNKEDIHQ